MDINKLNSDLNSIYNLGAKVHNLYEIIKDSEGEVDDEQFAQLQISKEEIFEVGRDITSLKTIIEGQTDTLDKEIKRLQDLKVWREKQSTNIEKALMYILLNYGEQDKKGIWRLDLGTTVLSSRKNPDKTIVEDESKIPNNYKKFDFILSNLTYDELEDLKQLLFNKELPPIETLKEENSKINQKIPLKELKPLLEELKEKELKIKANLKNCNISDVEELTLELEALPNYGAYIKEGELNLIIK